MKVSITLSIVLSSLFAVVAGNSPQTNPSVNSGATPSDIEANIQRLNEAKKTLSADPANKKALSVILALIKDKNGINRANAADALGDVGEDHGAAIKDSAIPVLIDMIERGDGFDQYAGLKALRSFGFYAKDALPLLKGLLRSTDVQKTYLAAETIGRMRAAGSDAVPDLVDVIKKQKQECRDDELHICRFGLQALGNIGPPAAGATGELVALLNDENPYLRVYAAVALIRIQPDGKEAPTVITRLLRDPKVQLRRRTIWELKDIGKEAKPVESMIKLTLSDKDEAVRSAGAELMALLRD